MEPSTSERSFQNSKRSEFELLQQKYYNASFERHNKAFEFNHDVDAIKNDVNQVSVKVDESEPKRKVVVIFGSGDLGRALVSCAVRKGYDAFVASRNPELRREHIERLGGRIVKIEECSPISDCIFLAIPLNAYETLPKEMLAGKILIDVSNRNASAKNVDISLAEKLQLLLPNSKVVKGFNTCSAYALQKGMVQGSKDIPVCSDDAFAKQRVMSLARDLGFQPTDAGRLSNARAVEDMPLQFFVEWKTAFITGAFIWLLMFIIIIFRRHICPNIEIVQNGDDWNWSIFASLSIESLHFSFSTTASVLVCACYFPGIIAAYLQLSRGTKYSRFPIWLDEWLKSRKYLGLIALFLALTHAFMVLGYGKHPGPNWKEYIYVAVGPLALMCLIILGVTSLPSVAAAMTWREFAFIHSTLGWTVVCLIPIHIVFHEWKDLFSNQQSCTVFPYEAQIIFVLCVFTIFLKIPLVIPPLSSTLNRIRSGIDSKH